VKKRQIEITIFRRRTTIRLRNRPEQGTVRQPSSCDEVAHQAGIDSAQNLDIDSAIRDPKLLPGTEVLRSRLARMVMAGLRYKRPL
jgi:hypothetical protein